MSEKIQNGWKWVKLGEVGIVITGKTPSSKHPKDWGYDMPFVTPTDFKNYRKFADDSERYLSSAGINKLKNKVLPEDSILVTCIGYIGKVVMNKVPVVTNQQINSIIPNRNIVFPDFLYYVLVYNYETFKSFESNGTAVPILNKTDFENIEVLIPPLPEQKAIAEVLSSIDDKIDLLHRQNKTLEEMAMTLFRQWFIEPTKDGLPEGWEEVSLGDIFDIGIGRTPPRKESYWFSLNPKDIRWISVKDLGPIDTYIINTSEFLKEESVKKFNIPIIPDNTVVLSFKLTVGRIGITIGEMVSNEAIAHFKLKPDSKISSNYLYLFLKTLDFSTFGSTSSIAEAINSKIIKEIKIHIPDDELITSFQSLINPVFQKIKLNTLEIQTLEKLRDTLLPKLMSGEVRAKMEIM